MLPLLGVIWVVTEYVQADGWPSRWSDSEPGGPGVWNPWWFYALGIWSVVLAVHAAKTYGHRPPTEDAIQREIDRIRARR